MPIYSRDEAIFDLKEVNKQLLHYQHEICASRTISLPTETTITLYFGFQQLADKVEEITGMINDHWPPRNTAKTDKEPP